MQQPSFKARLKSGKPLCGMGALLGEPALVEIAATAGIDYLLVDLEHGTRSYDRLEVMARTAQGYGLPAVARLPYPDASEATRLLEIGYCGTIVPHARTVAQIKAVIDASCHPPQGKRSFATCTRAGRYGAVDPLAYVAEADDNAIVGMMIEDVEAVEQADALLSVSGVDLAFIGRADLSLSMLGRFAPDDPAVIEATRRVVQTCRRHGVAPMTYIQCAEEMALYRELGIQLFNVSADTSMWFSGCQEAVRSFRGAIADGETR